jgi:hypothetical protein
MTQKILSFIILISVVFAAQGNDKSCYLPEMKGIHLDMTYGAFFDIQEVGLMDASLTRRDSTLILDHFITNRADVNQWTYTFFLPEWTLDGQVPSDAYLRSVEVIYANDYNIYADLVNLYGEPLGKYVGDKKNLFKYDAVWECIEADGSKVHIRLLHKRVYFERE